MDKLKVLNGVNIGIGFTNTLLQISTAIVDTIRLNYELDAFNAQLKKDKQRANDMMKGIENKANAVSDLCSKQTKELDA